MMGATLCDACQELQQALDTHAETRRAETLLASIASKVLTRILRTDKRFYGKGVEEAFSAVVLKECKTITNAAKVKPYVYRQLDKGRRRESRKQLANELRGARETLKDLRASIDEHEAHIGLLTSEIAARQRHCETVNANGPYPAVPFTLIHPHMEGVGLPEASGIYFLWTKGSVDYVGQSVNLNRRVRLGNHHVLRDSHLISFVRIDKRELTWAECYYIGVLQPGLNFGRHASHHHETRLL